jgi:hypothetical protein
VRRLLRKRKTIAADSGWQTSDLPRRHAPVFARALPIRAGWQWRSIRTTSNGTDFILAMRCNPRRAKWQALLIVLGDAGPSLVARFEDHGDHPGLHAHAHCGRGGIEVGASGLDDLPRLPSAQAHHRRVQVWTPDHFVEAALKFFRISHQMSLPL